MRNALEVAARYAANGGPRIISDAYDNAYYDQQTDIVHLMRGERRDESWLRALLHELCHSTGHWSRLGRLPRNGARTHKVRAREELAAEAGAAHLLHGLGLSSQSTDNEHAEYMASWLSPLPGLEDQAMRRAMAEGDEAADYIIRRAMA